MRRVLVAAVLSLAGLFAMAGMVGADEPPGDCWGGALSLEVMACYILEEAQRDGAITVSGIYRTPWNAIYVYLSHPEGLEPEVRGEERVVLGLRDAGAVEVLAGKAVEFLETRGAEAYYGNAGAAWCVFHAGFEGAEVVAYPEASEAVQEQYRACVLQSVEMGQHTTAGISMPESPNFEEVELWAGDRSDHGMWASWEQVWPTADGHEGVITPADVGGDYYVGDVSTEPVDVGCLHGSTGAFHGCDFARRFPELGLASGIDFAPWGSPKFGEAYVHVKADEGDEERLAEVARILRPELVWMPDYEQVMELEGGVDFKVMAVPYSWAEMAEWAGRLTRFGLSAGNTIGIRRAGLVSTWLSPNPSIEQIWTGGVVPVTGTAESGGRYTLGEIRYVLWVTGANAGVILEALPVLLPQLGIPVEAVGLVVGGNAEAVRYAGWPAPEVCGVAQKGVQRAVAGELAHLCQWQADGVAFEAPGPAVDVGVGQEIVSGGAVEFETVKPEPDPAPSIEDPEAGWWGTREWVFAGCGAVLAMVLAGLWWGRRRS